MKCNVKVEIWIELTFFCYSVECTLFCCTLSNGIMGRFPESRLQMAWRCKRTMATNTKFLTKIENLFILMVHKHCQSENIYDR